MVCYSLPLARCRCVHSRAFPIVKENPFFKFVLLAISLNKPINTKLKCLLIFERVDLAFLGCNGFHEDGPSIRSYRELEVKASVINSAGKTVILTDTSKIDKQGLYCFAPFATIDMIIFERPLVPQGREEFPDELALLPHENPMNEGEK